MRLRFRRKAGLGPEEERMYLKAALIVGGILGVVALAALSAVVYTENVVSTYSAYADGVHDGAKEKGRFPPFLAAGAFDIREVHNVDTSQQWLRFSVRREELGRVLRGLEPISLADARARHRSPRRWSGTWPPELGRFPVASPRAAVSFHRSTDQHGRIWCLAVDRSGPVVYGWTCEPAG